MADGWVLVLLAVATGAVTLVGGTLALRLASRLHLILGFSAGAVLGVALFDLLPEAINLGAAAGPMRVTALVAAGFFAYLAADRTMLGLSHGRAAHQGHFGAGTLSAHSLIDGLAIGLAFQASATIGIVVAVAVLAHDLADGINTVSVSLSGSPSRRVAGAWLAIDAAAPAVGVALSQLVSLSRGELSMALALFAGVFLYVGTSQLLPEAYRRHPRTWTTIATGLGLGAMWLAVRFAGSL